MIEDINILKFVLINGSKWSKLARQISDRNEHSLKNRFFSLLAKTTLTPIRKIKKLKIFLDKNNINDALTDLEAKLEIEIKEKTEKKDVFELSLFIENDKKEGGIMFNEEFLDVFESGRDLLPLWKI